MQQDIFKTIYIYIIKRLHICSSTCKKLCFEKKNITMIFHTLIRLKVIQTNKKLFSKFNKLIT